jgi:hypothetical protein
LPLNPVIRLAMRIPKVAFDVRTTSGMRAERI